MSDTAALWTPSQDQIETSLLFDFMQIISTQTGRSFAHYSDLLDWSVEDLEGFWSAVWEYCEIIGDRGDVVIENPDDFIKARFFPDSRINYAENLLRDQSATQAIIFRNEKGEDRVLSGKELYDQVSMWQQAMRAAGVKEGDRVAGYMPNIPETVIAMLAASSLGAIWSSASPDFGLQGVIDRFGQVEPKILISVDGYHYNGKEIDCLEKLKDIQPALKGLEKTVIVPFIGDAPDLSALQNAALADEWIGGYAPREVEYTRVAFNHPLFIMFSSGTTGVPKCIVHGHGGTLLKHMKEHQLQSNIKPGDKVFYFTTCGWMMWNWLVSALASKATLMLFDGSPFYPDGNALWDYADAHGCTLFGTSAKYIDALKNAGLEPAKTHDLGTIRTMCSTGSPLVHESFDYVYSAIKQDLHLASVSGGTDIIACFMIGNPISPVYRGELQGAGLGFDIDVLDDTGAAVKGIGGELVCKKPFPSMPVMFWNDADGERYRKAYFDVFDNIWCHGDWVERTAHDGFIIHGRSDATLNPGGVRIGTAEIYRQVEQVSAVKESIAIGQDFEGDCRVILFVVLNEGAVLDEALVKEIKTTIRSGASPRHVPAKVLEVTDIPRTKSGKITELAVRDVVMGRPIKNVEALANPESLELYRDLEALAS